ncbi:DMT family transporter [Geobacter sp. SVR]|uniref:DMT family transporter n=1 Tax=Geobacter sp. SVR TaxID=2495594 RepID=UPI00143F00D0|nr:EamA family transporter [Geobacter sp. SVR]BCS53252.1 membrane protein [Geobacter sp. SVR]GCF84638.1 membrane protein [Geobacter sp. SVR]
MHSLSRDHVVSRRGLACILLAGVLWGTVGITSKFLYGVAATTPLSVGFFRLALAVPVLLSACWLTQRGRMFAIPRHDLLLMLLTGMMTALYQLCYLAAVERTGVAVATLITLCTAPVMVAAFSMVITGERLSAPVLLALAGALAGTAVLVGFQESTGDVSRSMSGKFLALGSAFGYAVITLTTRRLSGRYHPIQPIAISFSIGALLLFFVALAKGIVLHYSPVGWGLLLYLGVIPTALAYVLFIAGIRHTTATVASVATLMEPLTSTILAWMVFGERFSALGYVGVVLLAGSLALLFKAGTTSGR